MPHYCFDTSALVKHYHTELGSTAVDRILGEPGSVFSIARLTLTEVPSVFAKKVRTGEIADADFDGLRLRFFADVRGRLLTPVRILNGHFEAAGALVAKYGGSGRSTPSTRSSSPWPSRSGTRSPRITSSRPTSGSATSRPWR